MDSYNQLLRGIGTSQESVQFVTTPGRAFVLIAQLQLALRHPGNTGYSAQIAREMAEHLAEVVCKLFPQAREMIEQGWDPECDVTREEFEAQFPKEEQ